jgi:hypothetical protein
MLSGEKKMKKKLMGFKSFFAVLKVKLEQKM